MGKIFITCPQCNQELSFQEIPGYQSMIVECPKCSFKATAGVYQESQRKKVKKTVSDLPTEFNLPSVFKTNIGKLKIVNSGEIFKLQEGTNIIGRKADSSVANIKIASDPFMSRQHLRIDVIRSSNGVEHRLIEINSKNIVELNGKAIKRGDILILKNGDSLTLGKTVVILEIDNSDT